MKQVRYGWWLSSGTLRYGDGRKARVGQTHIVSVHPACCFIGLHASAEVRDAFYYGHGGWMFFVKVSGKLSHSSDKFCGQERHYLCRISRKALRRQVLRDALLKRFDRVEQGAYLCRALRAGEDVQESVKKALLQNPKLAAGACGQKVLQEIADGTPLDPAHGDVRVAHRVLYMFDTWADCCNLVQAATESLLPSAILEEAEANGYVGARLHRLSIRELVERGGDFSSEDGSAGPDSR